MNGHHFAVIRHARGSRDVIITSDVIAVSAILILAKNRVGHCSKKAKKFYYNINY